MIHFDVSAHGHAIADRASCTFDPVNHTCISRESHGKLLGGVIYQDYTRVSISAHIAGFDPVWLSRDMLWVMFHYPFVQLNCSKLIGYVPSYNTQALAFDYKLGFKYITRVPDVFDNGDLIIIGMDRENCRWLKVRPKYLRFTPDGKR